MIYCDMWVGNHPGAMAFTWMSCCAHLQARSLVNAITPPLLAWYPMACNSADAPPKPAIEAILITLPDLWAVIALPTAWQNRKVPVRLVERTLSHWASVISSTGAPQEAPALLTRISTRPNFASVASTTA